SLIPVMKLRIARPSVVVDISRLGLNGVEIRDAELHLGPLTTWDELLEAPELRRPALAAIAECARGIGDLQVRNRGTVGGSLAHADPASDIPAVLLVLGATLELRSPTGERTVPLEDFVLGPFTTVLDTQEIITDVVVPVPAAGSGSAYVSVEHPASGFAVAGAAALAGPDGRSRVAVTGIAAQPFLVGGDDPENALEAAEIFGDRFAPAEYRRELAAVVARRAVELAAVRAKEDV
ncbi:MAG: FAD binding domain-containing protein, partial [Gaiellaceae bacterium]